jgi:imidazolonepropionase-like amidohydrolase
MNDRGCVKAQPAIIGGGPGPHAAQARGEPNQACAWGWVISDSDPIDTLQFTPDEIRAAVQVAADWGTYVATHVYTIPGIRRAIDAGVRSIEHGHMADEPTLQLMADRGVWLSFQPFQAGDNPITPAQIEKAAPTSHWDGVATWAKTNEVKVAFGTDVLFQPEGTGVESVMLTRFAQVFGNFGTLHIATSGNAELFAMSGERNPYKEAPLGVLQRGAWADMLLVNGDPIQNIDLLKDYDRNLAVIIKNGIIHKNLLV